jgi:hypothetical protein
MCPDLGNYGISWDHVAVKKLAQIFPEAHCFGRSTPLTAVKLKETLPNPVPWRERLTLIWIGASAIHVSVKHSKRTLEAHATRAGIARFIFIFVGRSRLRH